jgi:hypothetical protein
MALDYVACPFCRPHYRERTYISLNAIADGDISPSAAAGYGFDCSAGRLVVDARLVMNLGCRAVPLVRFFPSLSRVLCGFTSLQPRVLTSLTASTGYHRLAEHRDAPVPAIIR